MEFDIALRFNLGVLSDGSFGQYGPNRIFIKNTGNAPLIIMAGKDTLMALPVFGFGGANATLVLEAS